MLKEYLELNCKKNSKQDIEHYIINRFQITTKKLLFVCF